MRKPSDSAAIRDLTRGPVGRQLLEFALPLFLGSLIQLLYNAADLMFVRRILGKEASAAVGACILRLMAVFFPSAHGVAAVYPLTWACTVLCLFGYYKWGKWLCFQ